MLCYILCCYCYILLSVAIKLAYFGVVSVAARAKIVAVIAFKRKIGAAKKNKISRV